MKVKTIGNIRHIQQSTISPQKTKVNFADILQEKMQNYVEDWSNTENKIKNKIKTLNPTTSSLLELQNNIQEISLKTQLASQTVEAVTGTIKKLQNISGN